MRDVRVLSIDVIQGGPLPYTPKGRESSLSDDSESLSDRDRGRHPGARSPSGASLDLPCAFVEGYTWCCRGIRRFSTDRRVWVSVQEVLDVDVAPGPLGSFNDDPGV